MSIHPPPPGGPRLPAGKHYAYFNILQNKKQQKKIENRSLGRTQGVGFAVRYAWGWHAPHAQGSPATAPGHSISDIGSR